MKESMNVREILTILFKHKGKIALAFIATVATALIATLLMAPTYESTANLLVKYGREYVYRPEVGDKITQPKTDLVGIINAETQIITSQDLIDSVIKTIGAKNLYPEIAANADSQEELLEGAREKFASDLSVKGLEDSGVIQVSFDHKDAKMTARVVNTLIDQFKEKHLEAFIDPKSSSFLEQKAADYSKKLQETEKRLQDLKMKNTAYNLDEQRSLLLHQRSDLDASYKSSLDQIAELGKKLGALQGQVGTVAEHARADLNSDRYRVLDDAKSRLLELQLKEQEYLKKYTESSQTVTNLRSEIQTVQNFLSSQEKDLREKVPAGNPVYQDLQRQIVSTKADYQSQQAKSAAIREQIDEIDNRLHTLATPENELRDLQRELTTSEQNYQTYAAKLEEARMTEDMNRLKMTNISVIQGAAVPDDPIKPRKKLNLAIGIILGGLLGIGLAFLAEFLSQSFSTPNSVERRLGVPVLAVVPYRQNYLTR
jgi:uncharacterized protein involved in exopolysaccharide biosynthesis